MVSKYKTFLQVTAVAVLAGGGGWLCYQVFRTKHALDNIFNVDVLQITKSKAKYIYLTPSPFMELVDDSKDEIYLYEKPSVVRWWKSWKHSLVWRHLAMAHSSNPKDRLQAVRSLVVMKDLKDSDYWQVAQACDERTAVSLARTKGVDTRFFLKPPYSNITNSRQELISRLHDLLYALNQEKRHACLEYFLAKAFPDFQERHKTFDNEVVSLEFPQTVLKGVDLLPLCLKNLVHYSAIESTGIDIVNKGGLSLLMDVYLSCKEEMDILILLANMLASVSIFPKVLKKLHQAGWVGILAEWSRHPDIRLSAPSAKALANLDTDDPLCSCYQQRVYLLHPSQRSLDPIKVDVVFVHGLLGGVFITWRQKDHFIGGVRVPANTKKQKKQDSSLWLQVSDKNTKQYLENLAEAKKEEWEQIGQDFVFLMGDAPQRTNRHAGGPYAIPSGHQYVLEGTDPICKYTNCWPRDWLSKDCPYLRVLGVNYETSLSMWGPTCPAEIDRHALADRSDELLMKLRDAGVGDRPVVWVTHSMGGLLVKNMLVKAWESEDIQLQQVCRNTKGVLFYSVPHLGSPLAALPPAAQLLMSPTVEVQELRENSPALLKLHEKFIALLKDVPIDVISFAESKPTVVPTLRLHFTFVPIESADPGVGEFFEIPQDHLSICKPANRQSFLYQKVLHFISKVVLSS